MKRFLVVLALIFALLPLTSEAQFGKNKVYWEKVRRDYYETPHFDIYLVGIDLSQPGAQEKFDLVVYHLENTYTFFSKTFNEEFKEKVPVIMYRTHSLFEAGRIEPDFMPEGVGAFADPFKNRLVIKFDFDPKLQATILSHELTHMFQFYMSNTGLVRKVIETRQIPQWIMEGGADYMATLYVPYNRDDIRGIRQRVAAGNPEKYLPTWEMLSDGYGDPYSMGCMFLMFMEGKYGPDVPVQFLIKVLREHRHDLMKVMSELTDGKIDNPVAFDRAQRDYWSAIYGRDMLEKPRPYQETSSFKGHELLPTDVGSMPITSPVPSPDGQKIAYFSINKYGVVVLQVLDMTKPVEDKSIDPAFDKGDKKPLKPKTLTPNLPFKHFEYIVAQKLETWTFNGSDLTWSSDGKWIAFFARKHRDHTLFVVDSENGKIIFERELPGIDQAFSPSFDPTGNFIYFSGSKNLERKIYFKALLKDGNVEPMGRLSHTKGEFATSPAAAPISAADINQVAYVAFVGDYEKIFLYHNAMSYAEQLTFNRSNEDSPSFSADGKTLIFTSDMANGVWNLYTMDLETRVVRQWTDFYGGVFTPHFVGNATDHVVYSVYYQYDQYKSHIYPNFDLYEATLKQPLNEFKMEDKHESTTMTFQRESLFEKHLDVNQLLHPEKAPRKWKVFGRTADVGFNTYWGLSGGSNIYISDITEEHFHSASIAMNGRYLRVLNYAYLDQSQRMPFGFSVYDMKMPIYYLYRGAEGSPRQPVLNSTVAENLGISAFTEYPFNKLDRLEVGLSAEYRLIKIYLDKETIPPGPHLDLFNFLQNSDGGDFRFMTAYVHDSALYSQSVGGPLHGSLLRAQLEYAPPFIGAFKSHFVASVDARHYLNLSTCCVLASRFVGKYSTNPSGDFILMGGAGTINGYKYGSLIGNQGFYTNLEFRFPLLDALVFPHGVAIGPWRGLIFVDYGAARFNNQALPITKQISYGMGVQFTPFNFTWSRRQIDNYHDWKFDFSLGFNF